MAEEEMHFRGQRPGERVSLTLRQHPFTLVEHALKIVLSMLLLVLLYRLFGHPYWVNVVAPIVVLATLFIGFRSWYGWWNTMLLLTTERVLFVEQRGIASRKMSEALLDHIQFVTHEVKGVAHTIFNFGDVRIQTAGAAEVLILRELADPYEIQQRITRLQRELGLAPNSSLHPKVVSIDEEETD